jgi:hypothetical protein
VSSDIVRIYLDLDYRIAWAGMQARGRVARC